MNKNGFSCTSTASRLLNIIVAYLDSIDNMLPHLLTQTPNEEPVSYINHARMVS